GSPGCSSRSSSPSPWAPSAGGSAPAAAGGPRSPPPSPYSSSPAPAPPTPPALLVGPGRGAQLGILIKGPEVLESTRRVDTVVLDKTGTVTTGRMTLVDVVAASGTSVEAVRRMAAAVEAGSEHPIGRAIV